MAANPRGDATMVDVRLKLTEEQVQLLETLAEDDGPCDTPNDALQYVISEFEGLSVREPLKAD